MTQKLLGEFPGLDPALDLSGHADPKLSLQNIQVNLKLLPIPGKSVGRLER